MTVVLSYSGGLRIPLEKHNAGERKDKTEMNRKTLGILCELEPKLVKIRLSLTELMPDLADYHIDCAFQEVVKLTIQATEEQQERDNVIAREQVWATSKGMIDYY